MSNQANFRQAPSRAPKLPPASLLSSARSLNSRFRANLALAGSQLPVNGHKKSSYYWWVANAPRSKPYFRWLTQISKRAPNTLTAKTSATPYRRTRRNPASPAPSLGAGRASSARSVCEPTCTSTMGLSLSAVSFLAVAKASARSRI